jgi:cell division protein FtsQ
MSARRKKQKQKQMTKGRYRRWLKSLAVLLVVAASWQLSEHLPEVIMPIDSVQVSGSFEHLSQDDIRRQMQHNLSGDYFTADIAAMKAVLLSMPWVQEASVRRQWPSTIVIHVEEKQAVAYWSDDALLSDRGELFKPAKIDGHMQLPVIKGPDGLHRKVWEFMHVLHTKLSGIGIEIDELILDERRSWSMRLSNGVSVRLGRNETEKRMQRLSKVLAMQNAPNIDDIEYIDLRYPNGFALKSKSELDKVSAAGRNDVLGCKRHA